MTEVIDRVQRIRELNDMLRTGGKGGAVMMTSGFNETPGASVIFDRMRAFTEFTEDNDPHGEYDFGSVDFNGEKFFWKIDYYAPDREHGSEDPADQDKTIRVLTIMRASEY